MSLLCVLALLSTALEMDGEIDGKGGSREDFI